MDDSDPAKAIFKTLRCQIPADVEETLFQEAHLESRQLQYQKAVQRLADRATHAQLKEEMLQVKHAADEKYKSINILQSSGDELEQKISDLSAKSGGSFNPGSTGGKPTARCAQKSSARKRCPSSQAAANEEETKASGRLCR